VRVIVGTRGSRLARRQAGLVIARLREAFPSLEAEEKIIHTRGDEVRDRPLYQVGGQGLFVSRIEEALLADEIDLAVHSLKDLPTEVPRGLVIGAVPKREDPRDVLVSRGRVPMVSLPAGALVGTGSRRRAAQLLDLRRDLRVRDLRGNVDTRLRKVQEGHYDAIVMAAAALARLDSLQAVSQYFSVEEMVPAPGQGALAVQVREDDGELMEMVAGLDDRPSRLATGAERALLQAVGGGCALPVGGYAEVRGERLMLMGMVGTPDGSVVVKGEWTGAVGDWPALAEEAGQWLLTEFRERSGVDFLDWTVGSEGT